MNMCYDLNLVKKKNRTGFIKEKKKKICYIYLILKACDKWDRG